MQIEVILIFMTKLYLDALSLVTALSLNLEKPTPSVTEQTNSSQLQQEVSHSIQSGQRRLRRAQVVPNNVLVAAESMKLENLNSNCETQRELCKIDFRTGSLNLVNTRLKYTNNDFKWEEYHFGGCHMLYWWNPLEIITTPMAIDPTKTYSLVLDHMTRPEISGWGADDNQPRTKITIQVNDTILVRDYSTSPVANTHTWRIDEFDITDFLKNGSEIKVSISVQKTWDYPSFYYYIRNFSIVEKPRAGLQS